MHKKEVLLLGGTGAMGQHLSKILSEKGFNVSVTTRRDLSKIKNSSSQTITYVQGNAMDETILDKLLSEKHYDAIVDFMVYMPQKFSERINKLLSATDQYLFLSSSRVYASADGLITETSPRLLDVWKGEDYLNTQEYALSKARSEDILRQSGRRNWTIVRPYITYSEIRLQLGVMEKESWLSRVIDGKKIVFSKDIINHHTTLTYGYDVSRGIASLIADERAYGETFHITHPRSMKWSEVLDIYLDTITEVTGKRPRVFLTEECINRHTIGKWQVEVDRLYDRRFDNSKISEFIDLNSFVAPEAGLKKCLESFLARPEFLSINKHESLVMDKLAGDFSRISDFDTKTSAAKYYIKRLFFPLSKLM